MRPEIFHSLCSNHILMTPKEHQPRSYRSDAMRKHIHGSPWKEKIPPLPLGNLNDSTISFHLATSPHRKENIFIVLEIIMLFLFSFAHILCREPNSLLYLTFLSQKTNKI